MTEHNLVLKIGMTELTSINTTSIGDNAENNQGNEQSDLQAGKPELDLAIVLHSEEVCCDTQNQEYRNVSSELGISSQQEFSDHMQVGVTQHT